MKSLNKLRIGESPVEYGDYKLRSKHVSCGCKGCFFNKEQGARYCEMKECCMAHFRSDRTPVIFAVK